MGGCLFVVCVTSCNVLKCKCQPAFWFFGLGHALTYTSLRNLNSCDTDYDMLIVKVLRYLELFS